MKESLGYGPMNVGENLPKTPKGMAEGEHGSTMNPGPDGAMFTKRTASKFKTGWREMVPALRALAVERDELGARMTFEVNLDQSAGETSTAKKVLETLLAIAPDAQASLSVTREATVLG